ncbi:MAG: hypothetical protein NUV67_05355 [archaeon]|nr:hypothetical protein [archaeon]
MSPSHSSPSRLVLVDHRAENIQVAKEAIDIMASKGAKKVGLEMDYDREEKVLTRLVNSRRSSEPLKRWADQRLRFLSYLNFFDLAPENKPFFSALSDYAKSKNMEVVWLDSAFLQEKKEEISHKLALQQYHAARDAFDVYLRGQDLPSEYVLWVLRDERMASAALRLKPDFSIVGAGHGWAIASKLGIKLEEIARVKDAQLFWPPNKIETLMQIRNLFEKCRRNTEKLVEFRRQVLAANRAAPPREKRPKRKPAK